ncbi:Threonyl/alanyl tRNA synthetase SAD [Penicillium sp. CMV-2018d]|nr:Threonyl/alanyl tRNA synthetase SAD [Penicillium sp. CMV-2018d]
MDMCTPRTSRARAQTNSTVARRLARKMLQPRMLKVRTTKESPVHAHARMTSGVRRRFARKEMQSCTRRAAKAHAKRIHRDKGTSSSGFPCPRAKDLKSERKFVTSRGADRHAEDVHDSSPEKSVQFSLRNTSPLIPKTMSTIGVVR